MTTSTTDLLRNQVETQADTIKALWVQVSRLKKKTANLQCALEAERNKKPSPREIAEAVFAGEKNGQGQ